MTDCTCEQYLRTLMRTYQFVAVLSKKNGGQILRLRHKKLGRDMLLRKYKAPVKAYEALCGIRSPHLPEIYDVITLRDGQIVLEEFIDGITLSDVLECDHYRYRGAKKVLTAVCAALHILHTRGLVHRDIKPDNVMIDRSGRVVLIDLNASRQVSDASRDTVIMGTVGYVSPEQLGITQSDARTDIYAAGVMLNVMLTGKHPSEKIARGRAGRIVRTCTAVHPNDRYDSAEKLAKAL
ncbi:MAG: serine/threonine protein kinase [Clostridia bacterium]|nr:serine/threonine protein kinase [Clostridia bacterium]